MNKGLNQAAYTIVEVMIVLAITGALLVSVMGGIANQQRHTEFSQSLNDIRDQVNQVISNVSNGYYANFNDVSCSASGSGPVPVVAGTNNQGANKDCIFMGRAIQFGVGNPPSGAAFNIYNIIGQRLNSSNQNVTSLNDAMPRAIAPSTSLPNSPDDVEHNNLQYGLKAVYMYYTQGGIKTPISTFAFLSSLPVPGQGNNLAPGSENVELHPVKGTADISNSGADNSQLANADKINSADWNTTADGGVTVCFQSGGTDQYGILTIGGNSRQLSTQVQIQSTADAISGSGACHP